MTLPHADLRLRLVVDTNVVLSALISPSGAARKLIGAAIEGRVTFILSPLLTAEILTRAARPKFRQWFTEQDARELMRALILLSEPAQDPDRTGWAPISRDPDDDYLVALARNSEAAFLVSGDRDLHAVPPGYVIVRTVIQALEAINFSHSWGDMFVPEVNEG